mmetsp:Transcript_99723/g.311458  ORF Transcript_99723/g.311458 Transcript_99723/m.311458 type:complete len:252 (-) Transcript_99723:312-1067(-)
MDDGSTELPERAFSCGRHVAQRNQLHLRQSMTMSPLSTSSPQPSQVPSIWHAQSSKLWPEGHSLTRSRGRQVAHRYQLHCGQSMTCSPPRTGRPQPSQVPAPAREGHNEWPSGHRGGWHVVQRYQSHSTQVMANSPWRTSFWQPSQLPVPTGSRRSKWSEGQTIGGSVTGTSAAGSPSCATPAVQGAAACAGGPTASSALPLAAGSSVPARVSWPGTAAPSGAMSSVPAGVSWPGAAAPSGAMSSVPARVP